MRNLEPCLPLSHALSRGECTAHKCVVRVGVLSTHPVGCREVLRKNHEWSDSEECQEFQLRVVQLLRSQFVDEDDGDEGVRFPRAG